MTEGTTETTPLPRSWFFEDLGVVLDNINLQIQEVEKEAFQLGVPAHTLRTMDGDWVLRSLLVGKASIVVALAQVQAMENMGGDIHLVTDAFINSTPGK